MTKALIFSGILLYTLLPLMGVSQNTIKLEYLSPIGHGHSDNTSYAYGTIKDDKHKEADYSNLFINVYDQEKNFITTTFSDSQGTYHIKLPHGGYFTFHIYGSKTLPILEQTVFVPPAEYHKLDFEIEIIRTYHVFEYILSNYKITEDPIFEYPNWLDRFKKVHNLDIE